MLHVAPEAFFREFFSQRFGKYETADLKMKGADHIVDLQCLPFGDCTYDFVFASHVLEHIPDDHKAISEIRRILKPNGMAILPVPIYSGKTVEFSEPDPNEFGHVRAPGLDYFDRYERYFSKVERFASGSQPEKYQVFVYQDINHPSKREYPSPGSAQCGKLSDVVPVCYV
jgi:ubiquinone/menaquinone biosynthesis C-methylase UbiE